jgi:hypothetical protein
LAAPGRVSISLGVGLDPGVLAQDVECSTHQPGLARLERAAERQGGCIGSGQAAAPLG